ncbi:hypothetical protein ABI_28310 [Asticcacaulis biprosthecium C19]|uniref:Uncharacterized protein n=1 Tax=Asticcacaulis biprosthecium C19 TaxID=715226 RepID=F4QMH4_9CAUL|nr:DUF1963 domain-containing protein [Asticcacaulis biprosthecium]EGF91415.1 hypothetical protein ABI_28310 [Asticcacaulis biprosthecium C19]
MDKLLEQAALACTGPLMADPATSGLISSRLRTLTRRLHHAIQPGYAFDDIIAHQMLGIVPNREEVMEDLSRTHLLLMQFDSDPGMEFELANGGTCQFWITREDLTALRFDRVVVTLDL